MTADRGAAPVMEPPGDGWLRLCPGRQLGERADAVTFELPLAPGARFAVRGFVIRVDGQVRAYENRCAHVPVALDWVPGQVFDADRRHLVCSVHGAEYDPASGACESGPCRGRGGLTAIQAAERDGWIWVASRNARPGGMRPAAPPAGLHFRDDD